MYVFSEIRKILAILNLAGNQENYSGRNANCMYVQCSLQFTKFVLCYASVHYYYRTFTIFILKISNILTLSDYVFYLQGFVPAYANIWFLYPIWISVWLWVIIIKFFDLFQIFFQLIFVFLDIFFNLLLYYKNINYYWLFKFYL